MMHQMMDSVAQPPLCLTLIPVDGIPAIVAGDDLAQIVLDRLRVAGQALEPHDIIVFAQKVVSKSEGRTVDLTHQPVPPEAAALAGTVRKDPRLVALILAQSTRVVRALANVLIVRHRLGFTMANAGIDQSNVAGPEGDLALLLPENPDASAAALRDALQDRTGLPLGVVISDSFGRPWRFGTVGVAIGAAGIASLIDMRGKPDMFGRTLQVTEIGHADEIAAAASLLMGQANEARPVVILRGLIQWAPENPAARLIRAPEQDLFP